MTFYLITLGCPKNEVESEYIMKMLLEQGFKQQTYLQEVDFIIVNTCSFLREAIEENVKVINNLAKRKKDEQKLIVTGCLPQRFPKNNFKNLVKVDAWIPDWKEIANHLKPFFIFHSPFSIPKIPSRLKPMTQADFLSQSPISTLFYAYVNIAYGCSRTCTFCTIPSFKGSYKSRSTQNILNEIETLLEYGIKEVILIAQDTSVYGLDLEPPTNLAKLVQNILSNFPQIPRLRIMYCHPTGITNELIGTVAHYPQVCHYLDIPLQHSHPEILKKMGRPHNLNQLEKLLDKLKTKIPDICLRSTFIVGFPGETDKHFAHLLSFLQKWQLDKMGFFKYSKEKGTKASKLPNQVPEKVKLERLEQSYKLQEKISLLKNKKLVGKTLDVLVEDKLDEKRSDLARSEVEPHQKNLYIGRSYRETPEIDGEIKFENNVGNSHGHSLLGKIIPVKILKASTYDLFGKNFSSPIRKNLR